MFVSTSTRRQPVTLAGEEIVQLRYERQDATPRDALDLAELYRAEMAARGWELVDEEWYGIGRKLLFRKGEALASGQLVPTTLKLKVDDPGDDTVKIGLDLTRGDTRGCG